MSNGMVLLFFVGLLIVVSVFALKSPRRGKARRVSGPECGNCRYSAQGATTLICPECGSDFRDVGLLTPNVRPGTSRAGLVLSWTFLVVIIGAVVTAALGQFIAPTVRAFDETQRYSLPVRMGGSMVIALGARETIWPWQRGGFRPKYPRSTHITVDLEGPTGTGTMVLHPRGEAFDVVMSDNEVRTFDTPVTEPIVDEWMTDLGFDLTDAETETLAAEIFAEISDYASRTYRRPRTAGSSTKLSWGTQRKTTSGGSQSSAVLVQGGMSSGSSIGPHPWFLGLALGFWIAIWLLGLRLILRGAPTHHVVGT
jgi:hypothetical protein